MEDSLRPKNSAEDFIDEVAILILMEDSLRRTAIAEAMNESAVAILILMEDSLRLQSTSEEEYEQEVLVAILILMEDSLRHWQWLPYSRHV